MSLSKKLAIEMCYWLSGRVPVDDLRIAIERAVKVVAEAEKLNYSGVMVIDRHGDKWHWSSASLGWEYSRCFFKTLSDLSAAYGPLTIYREIELRG